MCGTEWLGMGMGMGMVGISRGIHQLCTVYICGFFGEVGNRCVICEASQFMQLFRNEIETCYGFGIYYF